MEPSYLDAAVASLRLHSHELARPDGQVPIARDNLHSEASVRKAQHCITIPHDRTCESTLESELSLQLMIGLEDRSGCGAGIFSSGTNGATSTGSDLLCASAILSFSKWFTDIFFFPERLNRDI
jgi:hypothetical protein